MYVVVALNRDQFEYEYDNARSFATAFISLVVIVTAFIANHVTLNKRSSARQLHSSVYDDFIEVSACPVQERIRSRLETYVHALNGMSDDRITLEHMAGDFLTDSDTSPDADTHLALLVALHSSSAQGYLCHLLRGISNKNYWLLPNGLILTSIVLDCKQETTVWIRSLLLLLLCADAVVFVLFELFRSKSFFYDPNDHNCVNTAAYTLHIPWGVAKHSNAAFLYASVLLFGTLITWAQVLDWEGGNLASYAYPILLVLRNEAVWRQCLTLVAAVSSALPLLSLWFYLLVVAAAQSSVLLHGQFNTRDYFVDMQFEDFYHSFVTMTTFLIGGNFVAVVEPALSASGLYIFFFMALSFVSLFYVSAILITIFMDRIEIGDGTSFPTLTRRREWTALTAGYLLLVCSDVNQEEDDILKRACGVDSSWKLSCATYQQALLPKVYDWVNCVENLVSSLQFRQEQSQDQHVVLREVIALATLCCECGLNQQFNLLVTSGLLPQDLPATLDDARVKMQLRHVLDSCNLAHTLKQQIMFVQGVIDSMGTCSTEEWCVHLLQNVTLPLSMHKESSEFARVMVTTAIQVYQSSRLIASDRIQVTQIISTDSVSQLFELDFQVTTSYRVIQLLTLLHLQKSKFQVLFHAFDINCSHQLDLVEFDNLWTIAGFLQCVQKESLSEEAELVLLQQEMDALEEEIGDAESEQPSPAILELAQLQYSYDQIAAAMRCRDDNFQLSVRDRIASRQILAIANLTIVACMASSTEDYAEQDWLLALFPIIFTIEHIQWFVSLSTTAEVQQSPSQLMAAIASVLLVGVGLLGAILLGLDLQHDVVSHQSARTLASFTVLLTITCNSRFGKMLLGISSAMYTCAPTFTLIMSIILLFALGSKDIFRDHVFDKATGDPAFDTMKHSLQSAFGIFVGEWGEYMDSAIEATTEAAVLWFAPAAFLLSILCAEVVIGVVILHYAQVQSVPHTGRLFTALAPLFNYQEQEREALITMSLRLNRALHHHEKEISDLVATLSDQGPNLHSSQEEFLDFAPAVDAFSPS